MMDNVLQTALACFRDLGTGLIALYGFGSSFTGESNAESDLDLAFMAKAPMTSERRFEIQEALARKLKKNVDLVDLSRASLVMKMQILSKGVRLFEEASSDCDRFETYVYSAYCRFNEERKGIIEDVSKRGGVY